LPAVNNKILRRHAEQFQALQQQVLEDHLMATRPQQHACADSIQEVSEGILAASCTVVNYGRPYMQQTAVVCWLAGLTFLFMWGSYTCWGVSLDHAVVSLILSQALYPVGWLPQPCHCRHLQDDTQLPEVRYAHMSDALLPERTPASFEAWKAGMQLKLQQHLATQAQPSAAAPGQHTALRQQP
jgi:hypothetical protein